ncbi:MAG TPA: PqqD family protein [Rhizomicrobium sp.]|nr:PqqD family protein [Rhizomicrobium sp.]
MGRLACADSSPSLPIGPMGAENSIEQAFEVNAPDVAGEIVDGEAIIMHLKRGYYYSLEGSGALIWGGVENRMKASAIADALASHFGLEAAHARQTVGALFEELLSHELVRAAAPPGQDADLSAIPLPACLYAEPRLEIFTDMQDLLLLDPIHDVDEAGWPVAPRQARV